jgi:two-component system response regulator RegA
MSQHEGAPAGPEPALTMMVVDDDPALRERLARAFRSRGYEVQTAGDAEEALRLARTESPDLAVLDLKMPGRSGLELLRELNALDSTIRVVVLTGYGSIPTAVEATRLGAVAYLPKPADADEILAAFARGATPAAASPVPAEIETPSLARAEWEHINRVLADCDGNVSEAARRLGIHRRSLQRKLQKYPPNR